MSDLIRAIKAGIITAIFIIILISIATLIIDKFVLPNIIQIPQINQGLMGIMRIKTFNFNLILIIGIISFLITTLYSFCIIKFCKE